MRAWCLIPLSQCVYTFRHLTMAFQIFHALGLYLPAAESTVCVYKNGFSVVPHDVWSWDCGHILHTIDTNSHQHTMTIQNVNIMKYHTTCERVLRVLFVYKNRFFGSSTRREILGLWTQFAYYWYTRTDTLRPHKMLASWSITRRVTASWKFILCIKKRFFDEITRRVILQIWANFGICYLRPESSFCVWKNVFLTRSHGVWSYEFGQILAFFTCFFDIF